MSSSAPALRSVRQRGNASYRAAQSIYTKNQSLLYWQQRYGYMLVLLFVAGWRGWPPVIFCWVQMVALEQYRLRWLRSQPFTFMIQACLKTPTTDWKCAICWEKYDENIPCCTLPCKHVFHAKCLYTWTNTVSLEKTPGFKMVSCPLCRQPCIVNTRRLNEMMK